MLVLTQKLTDGPVHLLVGDIEILVDVLEIKGNQIKLGYTAPKEVTILRDKVFIVDYCDIKGGHNE